MFNLFKKKTVAPLGKFEPMGKMSVPEAILKLWPEVPAIFSLHQITSGVRKLTDRMCLDSTVSSSLRNLRKQGKIDFYVQDKQLSDYRKL